MAHEPHIPTGAGGPVRRPRGRDHERGQRRRGLGAPRRVPPQPEGPAMGWEGPEPSARALAHVALVRAHAHAH
eukprot:5305744-Alexandrium_andersonii.AAC.1